MSTLPPWDQFTFTFFWEPYTLPIEQCALLNIQYRTSLGNSTGYQADPPPTPPYQLILYRGGSQPLVIPVNNSSKPTSAASRAQYAEDRPEQSGIFQWVANLVLGPSYTMAMKDAKGYSGGIASIFTMAPGAGGCNLTPDPMEPSTLDVSVSGSVQCGQTNLVVGNGTAPYKLEVVPGYGQPKTLYFATNQFGITLDMSAGTQYFYGNVLMPQPMQIIILMDMITPATQWIKISLLKYVKALALSVRYMKKVGIRTRHMPSLRYKQRPQE
ncbi:hypothetical protein FRC10_003347 [Ceratobasidium sp. 414]|nr:hypothetical protein FRC10_003347 [Ceratobasidium sp. 414]